MVERALDYPLRYRLEVAGSFALEKERGHDWGVVAELALMLSSASMSG